MSMKQFVAALATVTGLGASIAAAQVTIPTVPVGDPGNAPDYTGFGSVAYTYNIGKYEVTAGQYTAFLNAVAATDTNNLYNPAQAGSTSGSGITRSGSSGNYAYSVNSAFVNRPVNYVSFWDATRFANWLHNGQPTGAQDNATTEDGAYSLTPDGIISNTITRNAGARWAVTSENEWYKAAYYKSGSANAGYWDYPTGSDTPPGRDLADAMGNNANFAGPGAYPIDAPYFTTRVGEFQNSASPYGTFDQGGNYAEWNESIVARNDRVCRGGDLVQSYGQLRAISKTSRASTAESSLRGFRVSQSPSFCPSDINRDREIDFGDFLAFFNCYDTETPCADIDGNPGVDFGDFLAFFNGYDTGC
jgi:sulfatase modifying factor 1